MKKVLVLCTGNSCRSQMAEGYLRCFAGNKAAVYSAGVETHGVNPKAIATMKADGIDISGHTSNNVTEYRHIDFDYVITVCDHAREKCPFFPAKTQAVHHNFPDPAKFHGTEAATIKEFARVRDLIKAYAREFVQAYL
ncbi:arsenate reductase ArsC [Niabella sp. CC-SYL272]|uniref:arsenate reductase ArsC n=1 Tax=Niabella agricola TaxID=2891571 RepID=UPI001F309CB5|nr:arsenate reductase ArsC [Niabella agricola]MCF3107575.1 arsenate reductase ArsC [Niabella agricola]